MLSKEEINRYSRHILLKEIGEKGQSKLKSARVLVIGAGGLGCPVLLYLAAAGVGTIGIIDFDVVDESNLQRQVLFSVNDIGKSKALVAKEKLSALNPHIQLEPRNEKLSTWNAIEIFTNYDLIVDGTDNFSTRYLVNDACILSGKPLVYGSIHRFEGQVSVFNYVIKDGSRGPTYRCLFPVPPSPGSVLSCSEAGVLGVLPGIIGSLQANEAIKIIAGIGDILSGKMLVFDALSTTFLTLEITRNEEWKSGAPANPEQFKSFNYDFFCGIKNNGTSHKEINVSELKDFLLNKNNIELLDVREENEEPQIEDLPAIHIPLGYIESSTNKIDRNKKVVVFCKSGVRSLKAIQILEEKYGYSNLYNLKGGIMAWVADK